MTDLLNYLLQNATNYATGAVVFVVLTFLVAAVRRRRWAKNVPALEAEIDRERDPERRAALIRLHERLMAEDRRRWEERSAGSPDEHDTPEARAAVMRLHRRLADGYSQQMEREAQAKSK